jgi:hypothetical protein
MKWDFIDQPDGPTPFERDLLDFLQNEVADAIRDEIPCTARRAFTRAACKEKARRDAARARNEGMSRGEWAALNRALEAAWDRHEDEWIGLAWDRLRFCLSDAGFAHGDPEWGKLGGFSTEALKAELARRNAINGAAREAGLDS